MTFPFLISPVLFSLSFLFFLFCCFLFRFSPFLLCLSILLPFAPSPPIPVFFSPFLHFLPYPLPSLLPISYYCCHNFSSRRIKIILSTDCWRHEIEFLIRASDFRCFPSRIGFRQAEPHYRIWRLGALDLNDVNQPKMYACLPEDMETRTPGCDGRATNTRGSHRHRSLSSD